VVAPLAVGLLSTWGSNIIAISVIGVWSILSCFVELWLIERVWKQTPALRYKGGLTMNSSSPSTMIKPSCSFFQIVKAYWNHPVFLASFAYCLLYVSCLNWGGIMTSFLKSSIVDLSDAMLSLGRAVWAIVGIFATVVTPALIKRFGLVPAGTISCWCQSGCLALILVAFLQEEGSENFIILLYVSLSSSRFGLWSFDLIETQIMQERVKPLQTGIINGAQEGLMNFAYVLSFVTTLVFYDPALFLYPVYISFGCVVAAGLIYTWWAYSISSQSTEAEVALANENEDDFKRPQ